MLRRVAERRKGAAGPADQSPADARPSIAQAITRTMELLTQAREALASGNLAQAEQLAGEASALDVPESQFSPEEDRPSRLAADLMRAQGEPGATTLSAATLPMTMTPGADDYAQAAAGGPTPLLMAEVPAHAPLPLPGFDGAEAAGSIAEELIRAGETSLRAGDRATALEQFRAAYEHRSQLDLVAQQVLQGHLQMLSAEPSGAAGAEPIPTPDGALLDDAAAGQSVALRQLSADIMDRQTRAKRMREKDPNGALTLLREAREMVEASSLNEDLKRQLISRIDLSLTETEKYIKDHRAELELDAQNREILADIARDRAVRLQLQQRIAEMVDQFNTLVDEHRYAEAEVIANRLYEMAPDELVAQQVNKQAKMIRREALNRDIIARSEEGVANSFLDVRDTASRALADSTRDFGYDAATWGAIQGRQPSSKRNAQRTLKEIEIQQKLSTPVLPRYDQTPLSKVVESLSQLAGINIHLDPRGLEQEAVASDTPVTLILPQEIKLESALTLILRTFATVSDIAWSIPWAIWWFRSPTSCRPTTWACRG